MTFLTHEPGLLFSRITRRTSTLLPSDSTTCGYPQFRTFTAVALDKVATYHDLPFECKEIKCKH